MNSRIVKLISAAGAVAASEGDKVLRVRHALAVLRRLRGSPVRAALAMEPGIGADCEWPLQCALDNLACWSSTPFLIDAPHLLAAIAMVLGGPRGNRILEAAIGIISRSALVVPSPASESSGSFTTETI